MIAAMESSILHDPGKWSKRSTAVEFAPDHRPVLWDQTAPGRGMPALVSHYAATALPDSLSPRFPCQPRESGAGTLLICSAL